MKSTKQQNGSPVPAGLLALAALVDEARDCQELAQALDAARKALAELNNGGDLDDFCEALNVYVDEAAERGSFAKGIARVEALDVDLVGTVHNAYTIPALYAGMAISWLVLKGEASR